MNKVIKIGLAAIIMSILANLLFRGGADKDIDIPALIKNGALVIDTRTAAEFAGGPIEGAVHIPHDIIEKLIEKNENPTTKPLHFFFPNGKRSPGAKQNRGGGRTKALYIFPR